MAEWVYSKGRLSQMPWHWAWSSRISAAAHVLAGHSVVVYTHFQGGISVQPRTKKGKQVPIIVLGNVIKGDGRTTGIDFNGKESR